MKVVRLKYLELLKHGTRQGSENANYSLSGKRNSAEELERSGIVNVVSRVGDYVWRSSKIVDRRGVECFEENENGNRSS